MVNRNRLFVVWWLTQPEVNAIALTGGISPLPAYLAAEVRSLLGRDGRGRLWVNTLIKMSFTDVEFKVDFPNVETAISQTITLGSHGGIVVWNEDISKVAGLPGFITDFSLNRIWRDLQ